MTDTQHTPTTHLDLAGGSEEERLAAHVADSGSFPTFMIPGAR